MSSVKKEQRRLKRSMRRWIATGLLAAVLGATLPSLALASVSGRRNTALGLTGLAVYELFRHHTTTGILAGAGAAYAWSRYSQARRSERRERRYVQYYRDRYYSGYRPTAYYSSGYPYSRVAGYRSSYGRRYSRRRHHSSTYQAGYRAGYRRGIRVCRAMHGV